MTFRRELTWHWHPLLWRDVCIWSTWRRVRVGSPDFRSFGLGTGSIFLLGKLNLVHHKLWDFVRELWSDGQHIRLGLESILVSHVLQLHQRTVRSSVPVIISLSLQVSVPVIIFMCIYNDFIIKSGVTVIIFFIVCFRVTQLAKCVHHAHKGISHPSKSCRTYEYWPALTTAPSGPSGEPDWE